MWIQRIHFGVSALAYSPDGRALFVADYGSTVSEWDVSTRQRTRLFGFDDKPLIRGLAVVSGGRHLLLRRYPAVVWDLRTGTELDRLATSPPHDVRPLSTVEGRLVYRAEAGQWLYAWEPEREIVEKPFAGPFPGPARTYDVAPDDASVALVSGHNGILFDVASRAETARFAVSSRPDEYAWGVRYAPDGRTLAVFCRQQVQFWDVERAERLGGPLTLNCRYGDATFAFHPSAPIFVATNRAKVPTLFSLETGEPIRSLDFALGRYVTCTCFAPDGLTCAVGGSNKQFAVFDVDV